MKPQPPPSSALADSVKRRAIAIFEVLAEAAKAGGAALPLCIKLSDIARSDTQKRRRLH